MKFIKCFLWVFLTLQTTKLATQTDSLYNRLSTIDFVYFNDGSYLENEEFRFKTFFKFRLLDANKEELPLEDVRYLQTHNKFYSMYQSMWLVERKQSGYFNLFTHNSYMSDFNGSYKRTIHLYAHALEEVKLVNYNNVLNDLELAADYIESAQMDVVMELMEKGQRKNKRKKPFLISSGASFLLGMALFGIGERREGDRTLEQVGMGFCVAGLAVGTTVLLRKPNKTYRRALQKYNQFYREN